MPAYLKLLISSSSARCLARHSPVVLKATRIVLDSLIDLAVVFEIFRDCRLTSRRPSRTLIARSFEKLSSVPLMINSTVRPGENNVISRFSEFGGDETVNTGVTVLCQRRVSFTRGYNFVVFFRRGVRLRKKTTHVDICQPIRGHSKPRMGAFHG